MSQEFKYTAIVLGKADVGETDRIYTFYTRESGKIRAMGRGAKKSTAKLAGNLETGNLVEVWVMKGKGLGNISGAIALDHFSNLRLDFEKLDSLLAVFKILGRLISEEEKDEKVFDLLLGYLRALDQQENERILTLGFLFKFLDSLGYRFQMNECVLCQRKLEAEGNFFGFPEGGVICSKCSSSEANKMRISADEIKLVRIFLANNLSSLSKIKVSDKSLMNLRRISEGFLKWIR
ncbi:MAG: DNA repair protein RecO [Patescibacteria group bacterium]